MKKIFILCMIAGCTLACKKDSVDKTQLSAANEGLRFYLNEGSGFQCTKSSVCGPTMADGGKCDIMLELTESGMDLPKTKSAPIDGSNLSERIPSIDVYGWNNTATVLKNPTTVSFDGTCYIPGSSDISDLSTVSFKTPRFYGFPFSAYNGGFSNKSTAYNTLYFTYTMPAPNTTDNTDAEKQDDLLMATFEGNITELKANSVNMKLNHIMAGIRFAVSEEFFGEVTIDHVTISDINSVAKFTYTTDTKKMVWSDIKTLKTYVQTFGKTIKRANAGKSLDDDDMNRTFFVIPQSFGVSATGKITVNYTIKGVQKQAVLQLKGTNWEAGKMYTYTITKQKDEPWVDFLQPTLLGKDITLSNMTNEYLVSCGFSFYQKDGTYEKILYPVHNLVPETWYEFSFTNTVDPESWNSEYVGSYSCAIRSDKLSYEAPGASTQITHQANSNNTKTDYFWYIEQPSSKRLVSGEHSILFYATAEDMWWQWEVSALEDKTTPYLYYEIVGFKELSEPEGTFINTVEATSSNFTYGKDSRQGYDTFKSFAEYATDTQKGSLEFHMLANGNKEKINIPIENLDTDCRYTISFKYVFDLIKSDTSNKFGVAVASEPNTTNTVLSSLAADLGSKMTQGTEYEVSFDFVSTAETMYWIWDCSRLTGLSSIKITDITIEKQYYDGGFSIGSGSENI